MATVAGVRHVLVTEQRRAGHKGGVVMEGRDIGTVVFPDAELKIFLTASPEIRAERRWREHQQKGDAIDFARTLEEIRERDKRDRERTTSPLVQARDAVRGGQHRHGAGRSCEADRDAGQPAGHRRSARRTELSSPQIAAQRRLEWRRHSCRRAFVPRQEILAPSHARDPITSHLPA